MAWKRSGVRAPYSPPQNWTKHLLVCALVIGLQNGPAWRGSDLRSANAIALPTDPQDRWSASGTVKVAAPPSAIRAISEDGRYLLAEYPSGATIMGFSIPKILVRAVNDGTILDVGIPTVASPSPGGGRMQFTMRERGTGEALDSGFEEPLFDQVDDPRYWLEGMLDQGHVAFGYRMWSPSRSRRFQGEALAEVGPGRWGKSITLADPLTHLQGSDFLVSKWFSAGRMDRLEVERRRADLLVFDVTYDWRRRNATARLIDKVPARYRGFPVAIAGGDSSGVMLLTDSRRETLDHWWDRYLGNHWWLRTHGKMAPLPKANWEFWRGRPVSFDKGDFKEFVAGSVRSLATGYEFLGRSTSGRFVLVREVTSGRVSLLHFG